MVNHNIALTEYTSECDLQEVIPELLQERERDGGAAVDAVVLGARVSSLEHVTWRRAKQH